MNESSGYNPHRVEWLLRILERVESRGIDVAGMPLSLELVTAVVETRKELHKEDRIADGAWPGGFKGDPARTLGCLARQEFPEGGFGRIKAIIDAEQEVETQSDLEWAANQEVGTWHDYMERGSARCLLGRLAEGFADYAVAKSLIRQLTQGHNVPVKWLSNLTIQDYFRISAGGDARDWQRLVVRAYAHSELGAFDHALADYAHAESMAERREDKAFITDRMFRLISCHDAVNQPAEIPETDCPDEDAKQY